MLNVRSATAIGFLRLEPTTVPALELCDLSTKLKSFLDRKSRTYPGCTMVEILLKNCISTNLILTKLLLNFPAFNHNQLYFPVV